MTATIFAYLDAGSASAIVTLILGGVAGIGVALKHRWNQFLVLLHIRKPAEDEQTPPADEPNAPARAEEPVETINR
jgi:hypothetical protein